jgi:hypothetical protein
MISSKSLKEMKEFIQEHLTIKVIEKKKWGEVFTPVKIIDKMLDSLSEEIFTNPDLKWFDPCAGIGNFIILVYFRLMDGLVKWEPDSCKRSNHIIQNMLYINELNADNVEICKNIFIKETGTETETGREIETKINANIYCQDFLKFDNNIKFDIIIGNPPFQLKDGKGGKNKLYEKIVNKALTLLNCNGILLFLVPDNLFCGNSSKTYFELIKTDKYHIKWIDFSSFWSIKNIQQKICCFLLERRNICKDKYKDNEKYFKKTKIVTDFCSPFEVELVNRSVNPIRKWTLYSESLLNTYLLSDKNKSIYNRGKNLDSYSNTFSLNCFILIYCPNKFLYTNNEKLAIGVGLKKIVIYLISTNYEYYMDWTGEYGVGPNTIYIPFTNEIEGKKLESFFKSETYKELMFSCKTCRQFIKLGLIQYLDIDF